jgi:hypothetical protein
MILSIYSSNQQIATSTKLPIRHCRCDIVHCRYYFHLVQDYIIVVSFTASTRMVQFALAETASVSGQQQQGQRPNILLIVILVFQTLVHSEQRSRHRI